MTYHQISTRNRLLALLPRPELEKISPDLEPVELALKQVLHGPDEKIAYVYFITRGVVSMVNEPDDGDIAEFATIGSEGIAGFPVLLGASSMPSKAIVQIPGDALRISTADFRRALDRLPTLQPLLLRYTMALLNQVAQVTSCNRLHEVQERCARWLLQTQDRVNSDSFPLTQEFLAQMLGVHRPTVTVAAGILQKAGLIDYTRGSITIINRKALEAASCNCYRVIAAEYERLLNSKG
jgi:CRP-like cAMP-binding protein